jgi:small-conductance mechanosensitive channel
VALALQDTLANLFAASISSLEADQTGRLHPPGLGVEGFVTEITWRYSNIRALSNNITIIPNAELAKAVVVNFDLQEQEMSVLVPVGVSYDSDLEQVEQVTREVAREVMEEVEGGIPGFDPLIRYHTFNDFSIDFNVIMRSRQFADQHPIKHEFIKRLHRRYLKEGIEIPFPIRTLHIRQAEASGAGTPHP